MIDFSPVAMGVAVLHHRHKLGGTITVDGLPEKRLVWVLERIHMQIIATRYSDATTGQWEVTGLPEYPERSLLVMALDSTGAYNAEVADYVSQVATV